MVTYAGVPTDIKKVQEAIKVIKYEHESLVNGNIIDSELARAKEILKGRLILSLEDTFNVGYIYGKQLLHEGEIKPVEEIIKRIEDVSANDVIHLAKDIIKPSQSNLALIGPFKSPTSFEKIIANE
jgi:predicted Zn-dependent peptidase